MLTHWYFGQLRARRPVRPSIRGPPSAQNVAGNSNEYDPSAKRREREESRCE